LSPLSNPLAKGRALPRENEPFGSVEQWQAASHAIGEMRGVGWVILIEDPAAHWLTNRWGPLHHAGVPAGFTPLLVMDVWERVHPCDSPVSGTRRLFAAIYWTKVQ
jgi:Fe-Mn family superoxide dismutase